MVGSGDEKSHNRHGLPRDGFKLGLLADVKYFLLISVDELNSGYSEPWFSLPSWIQVKFRVSRTLRAFLL